ncbi:hypothetical protein BDY17DRAFT_74706 [Neohortaea acidophila]|uniref:DUF7730 domain-containing protein n=1 Tax=Neohortaea acidophila TaxID=245834 RepID=A0A6A6Q3R5_9PEZI|nr:uncharacterized protein BDY17DRAFT_74706 [Neohortaea acidophila]KAF2486303.1 hypothetical protein BDY17DRAFT_74706 [Neohortaea acidophila]
MKTAFDTLEPLTITVRFIVPRDFITMVAATQRTRFTRTYGGLRSGGLWTLSSILSLQRIWFILLIHSTSLDHAHSITHSHSPTHPHLLSLTHSPSLIHSLQLTLSNPPYPTHPLRHTLTLTHSLLPTQHLSSAAGRISCLFSCISLTTHSHELTLHLLPLLLTEAADNPPVRRHCLPIVRAWNTLITMDDSPLNLLPPELRNNIYKLVLSTGDIHVSARTTVQQDVPISCASYTSELTVHQNDEVEWMIRNRFDQPSMTTIVNRYTTVVTASATYALLMTCKQVYAESKGYRSRELGNHVLHFDLGVSPFAGMRTDTYEEKQAAWKLQRHHDAASARALKKWVNDALRNSASHPGSVIIDFGVYRTELGSKYVVLGMTPDETLHAITSVFSETPVACFLTFRIV